MRVSKTFLRLVEAFPKYRTFILQGGTSSTKTYSILQFFYLLARQSQKPLVFSVVAESVPALRRGALRDWVDVMGDEYSEDVHNKTEATFNIGKSKIEFFAVDHPDKAKFGKRDFLFVNEANRIPLDMYNQLAMRTRLRKFIDFNPDSAFWAHDLKNKPGIWFDVSTYKDAYDAHGKALISQETIRTIESYKDTNPNWWKIYGKGEIGSLEGLIFPPFEIIPKLPAGLATICGQDFGYTNDPTVLLERGEYDRALYINQLIYARGMTNPDIVAEYKRLNIPFDYPIYADCAEPKSIREIYDGGFYGIKPCVKGADCFQVGIDHIRRYKKIYITENSVDVIKDCRNAMWEKDITGKTLNRAKRAYLHSLDALIYSFTDEITPAARTRGGNIPI